MNDYVITNGEKYVFKSHSGKYIMGCETMADVFTKNQAVKILNNSLPKEYRKTFQVKQIYAGSVESKPVKEAISDMEVSSTLVENLQPWIDKINTMNGLETDMLKRKEILMSKLSLIDKEISDLMHYIEFTRLNAAQGYNAYKMTKECRERRRIIKNEIKILDIILNKKISEIMISEIQKGIEYVGKSTYKPRVLKGLFKA